MSEVKPYLRAIGHTPQSIEQIANLPLQLEISAGGDSRSDPGAAEMRYLHNPHLVIENRLPASNDHILDSTELVSLHQLQKRTLLVAQPFNRNSPREA